ncbi:IucA/IucC family protein [Streptomyces sp. NPDC008150]|uniref:IucA/IucC family protein n=1 Tax=Streptomyces sp. NPDC008150 TaxID=3364816 RepID=UPI0036F07850
MHRPPTAATDRAAELAALRPGLADAVTAELPGARAAVLTRLWRALAYEPLPWITRRAAAGDALTLYLADGRRLGGPAADPYATDAYVEEVRLGGTVYDDPARLMTDLAVPHGTAFAIELAHSVSSLALSRAGRTGDAESSAREWPTTDWEWEQRVVDGHPFHPNCRSRPGFSAAEELAYGPEHRPVVRLRAVAVEAGECRVSGEWPDDLRDGTALLLPVHPWQARHVLRRTTADLTDAHPLMSLRTLALPGGPHVKTALSARLTSSVRDISVASVTGSAALSAFAETVAERTDGLLHVTRTLGAATADSPDLAAVLRESPQAYVTPGSGERVLPVAALATTGLPASPVWLASFARLALTVGLRLLELGVALEAHGQNLLVVLSARGEPLRLVYRDLADLRISPARLARHGARAPEVAPRMLTDDVTTLRRKLFGALVAGALAGTAGSRAALGAAMAAAASDLPHTGDLVPLLHEDVPAKALTLMRLSPGTPGDQWTRLPNPLS